jgi:N-acylneuraminate cytidylyltransferase
VVVSTDDDEIASVAAAWGADVPFLRPAEYAQDLSPDIDVFRHALDFLAQQQSYTPDMVVHLRPTGPVRRVDDIDAAIGMLASDPDADAVRSVSVVHQTPYKMWHLQDDGTMTPMVRLPGVTDSQSLPRQRLPLAYWQNGYVDVLRPRAVLEKQSMWGERVLSFIVETETFELDYMDDIARVEQALHALAQGGDLPKIEPGRHPV